MRSNYDRLDFLCRQHAETLGVRAVAFIELRGRGSNAAGRVVRLAQMALSELTDFHRDSDGDDWKEDSEILYTELLAKAQQIGALSKERCTYWFEQLRNESTAAGRLRMVANMQVKNERHTPLLVQQKVENLHVLNGKDAYGERPEPTEYERLTA